MRFRLPDFFRGGGGSELKKEKEIDEICYCLTPGFKMGTLVHSMLSHYNALMQCIDWLYLAMKVRRKTGLGMYYVLTKIFKSKMSLTNVRL